MTRHASIRLLLCTMSLLGWHGPLVSAADEPETVMVTFHAKAGAEAMVAQVIADHFATARQLNLVLAEPHLTVRMGRGRQGRARGHLHMARRQHPRQGAAGDSGDLDRNGEVDRTPRW